MSDPEVTSTEVIKVLWDEITPGNDGGSEVTSYSLEIDDGTGGDFTPVVGLENGYLLLEYTITGHNITKGVLYRLRYRAKNIIGWGEYS